MFKGDSDTSVYTASEVVRIARISAAGRGESEPIAGNDDGAGRMLNRRVEVECSSE